MYIAVVKELSECWRHVRPCGDLLVCAVFPNALQASFVIVVERGVWLAELGGLADALGLDVCIVAPVITFSRRNRFTL